MTHEPDRWPSLPLDSWRETYETLHLWTQIVGKIRMECMPWINHSWHVPLYVSARGLATSLIPREPHDFEIEFDFHEHRLRIATTRATARSFDLEPMTVADFHSRTMEALHALDLEVAISPLPVEIPDPILPFHEDRSHGSYDRAAVERFWRILLASHRVLTRFRAEYIGKASPVHFFWGAFDLAASRFSGREAPRHPGGAPNCADWVMEEAYSHEVSSAGFWPGGGPLPFPLFYSYVYPEPDRFRSAAIRPEGAFYDETMGEFVLPYDLVRAAEAPERMLLEFYRSTYEAAADLGGWDRKALERESGSVPPDRTTP
ncbi:MAG: hypothetical protein GF346_08600 [Candidatus Eisenbacteria bacterium]|nr:hypothetical protein [Candidatus Latescibacterota bacterium]MBD3302494.1 hypothetical protein [Candidatus Eisenbacteria bacterium]